MSYNPKRRKSGKTKRSNVPPQLRSWVFGRRKTHDPKRRSMSYGYGTIGRKPYRKGSRGGVAWSGGRKLRYDIPRRFSTARRYGSKLEGWISKYGSWIGFLGVLGIGVGSGYNDVTKSGGDYVDIASREYQRLYRTDGNWSPINYLKFKFLGLHPDTGKYETSAWVLPFWVSLIGYIVSFVMPNKYRRIKQPLGKVCQGGLIASTIGALVLPGSDAKDFPASGGSTTFPSTTSAELSYWR